MNRTWDMFATGDFTGIEDVVGPSWFNHESVKEPPPGRRPGPAGLMGTVTWLREAFPDLRFRIEETIVAGDKVVQRVVMLGTQRGPLILGTEGEITLPPTNRSCEVEHMHIFRIEDGLVVEHWAARDDLTMMYQLGHLPQEQP